MNNNNECRICSWKVLRELELPPDVVSPWQTVQLCGSEFIVCHGRTSDPVHRVCHVASDGHVAISYGGPQVLFYLKISGKGQKPLICR